MKKEEVEKSAETEKTPEVNRSRNADGFCKGAYRLIVKHPYITLGLLCVLFGVSTGCCAKGVNFGAILLIAVAAAGAAVVLQGCFSLNKKQTAACACVSLGVMSGFCALACFVDSGILLVRVLCIVGSMIALLHLWRKKRLDPKAVIVIALLTGFMLRALAVLNTDVVSCQHDVSFFSSSQDRVYTYTDGMYKSMVSHGAGHAGYIEYLFHNGRLPDFDMRNVWSFYNPPFFHIIAALWLRFAVLIFDYPTACESIQIIPLFCSCAIVLLSIKLFRLIGLKGRGLAAAVVLLCASSTFISFSFNANNDPPAAALSLAAVTCALDWYRSRRMSDILKTALTLGLAMMTKLSSALMAVPIAFVFLYAFFSDVYGRKKPGRYFLQFPAFLAVCAPLGLFYQIRNLIRFGIPMSYIQVVDNELPEQYLGNLSVWQRLFTVSPDFLFPPWVHTLSVNGAGRYSGNDYNPIVMLYKTALFEEYQQNSDGLPVMDILAAVLLIMLIILSVIAVVTMVRKVIDSKGDKRIFHIFLGIAFFTSLISYVIFCIKYPYLCSQHIRYVPLISVIACGYIGFAVSELSPVPFGRFRVKGQLSRRERLETVCYACLLVLIISFSYWQILIF